MTDPNPASPAPGWYRDAASSSRLRWWDGNAWTEHVRERPEPAAPAAVIPVEPRAPAAAAASASLPAAVESAESVSAVGTPQPVALPVVVLSPAPPTPVLEPGADAFALMAAATGAVRVIPPEELRPEGEEPPAATMPHRRRLGLVIGLAIAAVVVAVGIVFVILDPLRIFVPGLGYTAQVEDALAVSIEAESRLGVTSVDCPPELTTTLATSFPCTVDFDDGSSLGILATIVDGGQTVQWSPAD